ARRRVPPPVPPVAALDPVAPAPQPRGDRGRVDVHPRPYRRPVRVPHDVPHHPFVDVARIARRVLLQPVQLGEQPRVRLRPRRHQLPAHHRAGLLDGERVAGAVVQQGVPEPAGFLAQGAAAQEQVVVDLTGAEGAVDEERERRHCSPARVGAPLRTAVPEGPYGTDCHVPPAAPATAPTRSTRTAHVLNSGIRDTGSRAGLVRVLARPAPGQWNGMNTVSGRTAAVIRAGATTRPRRDTTASGSPSAEPSRSASRGCSSTNGPGAASFSSATRRVCAPDWYWATTRPVVSSTG